MDIRLALMTGIDIPVPELQTAVHQPTIKEISYIGEQEFFIGLQTLSINKNMIKEFYENDCEIFLYDIKHLNHTSLK